MTISANTAECGTWDERLTEKPLKPETLTLNMSLI